MKQVGHNLVIDWCDDDGYEITVDVRCEPQVCSCCNATGRHVNPNIDGHGITADEMAELGDEFIEDYMAGVYDVICEECGGSNIEWEPVESLNSPEVWRIYGEWCRQEAEYAAMVAAERRMGC